MYWILAIVGLALLFVSGYLLRRGVVARRAALVRVNLQDGVYQLMRVIDGDTLEVHPPSRFSDCMRDVHIRLYGIDAPERHTDLGPTYTSILSKLCDLNSGCLYIVWERERTGTEYAGYPTGSFERGIGNLFIDIGNGVVLYVNAVLASLPDVRIERGPRRLIRAARHIRDWPRPLWHHWHYHWRFVPLAPWPPGTARGFLDFLSSSDVQEIRSLVGGWPQRAPCSVWVLPPPDEWPADPNQFLLTFAERCGCRVCRHIASEVSEDFPRLLQEENATPFDALLLLAHAWGHPSEEEGASNKVTEIDR